MWNTWLEKGSELAQKAKEAAEKVESQLNNSVGISNDVVAGSYADEEEYEYDDNGFFDDDEENVIQETIASKQPSEAEVFSSPVTTEQEIANHAQTPGKNEGKAEVIEPLAEDEINNEHDDIIRTKENDETMNDEIGDEDNEGGWHEDDDIMLSQDDEDIESIPGDISKKEQTEESNGHVTNNDNSDSYSYSHNQREEDSIIQPPNENRELEIVTQCKEVIHAVEQPPQGVDPDSVSKSESLRSVDSRLHVPLETSTGDAIPPNSSETDCADVAEDTPELSVSVEQPRTESAFMEHSSSEIDYSLDDRKKESHAIIEAQQNDIANLKAQVQSLADMLRNRESQLEANADKFASLASIHEQEKEALAIKMKEIKEEAKKRIQRAKEKVEESQSRMNNNQADKDIIIEELRKEGENLAKSQGIMEQNLRQARAEVRDLLSQIETLTESKEDAEANLSKSKEEVEDLKKELKELNKEKERAGELSKEIFSVKEESQQHEAVKLSLEQEIKTLKKMHQEYVERIMKEQEGKLVQNTLRQQKIQSDKEELIIELEKKSRRSEREANVREDALRHEVEELRKRWQDAVRRADALSMDVQQSTAPLIRQLESTERQNRTRVAAWAELEQKLRSELEASVIENENEKKMRIELQTKYNTTERHLNDKIDIIDNLSGERDNLVMQIEDMMKSLENTEDEKNQLEQKNAEMKRIADESTKSIKNEMMLTLINNEERFTAEIDDLKYKLSREVEQRSDLEEQLESLVKLSSSAVEHQESNNSGDRSVRLSSVTDQVSILEDTLVGLGGDENDEPDSINNVLPSKSSNVSSSFAAMEHLSQSLRASKLELEALRKQLISSEKSRESLSDALSTARIAADKLPLFERKVADLSAQVEEKNLDIAGLRDDVMEIKDMYRAQLDSLLEEQAQRTPLKERAPLSEEQEGEKFSTPSDYAAAAFDISYSG